MSSDPHRTDEGFWSAVEAILNTNIVRADTLADAQVIELVAYRPGAEMALSFGSGPPWRSRN